MVECKNPQGVRIMRPHFFMAIFLFAAANLIAGTIVDEIVAHVGNEIITKSELEQQRKRLYDELSHRLSGDELQKQYDDQSKQLLDFMINQKLMDQKAKELSISVDDDVNAAIKRLREENQIPDDQALEGALQKEGSSLADLREDFRKRIIQQRILWNYVQGKVNITEDEIKTYYEQHKTEMMTEASTKVRRYEVTDASADKSALQAEAKSVADTLRAGKDPSATDFTHLKISESTDLAKSELDPKFAEMLDKTAVGSYTDPIETSDGWFVLKVESRQTPAEVKFEDARTKIYNFLLQQRAEKYQKEFLEDLRKQAYVVVNQTAS